MIEIQPLQWAIFGAALGAVGMLTGWLFIRALAVGALITAVTSWALHHDKNFFQVIMWLTFSVISWWSGRRNILREQAYKATSRRSLFGVIGRIGEVSVAIEDGKGKVVVNHEEWGAKGPDVATGTKVKVIGEEGGVLIVALRYEPDEITL